MSSVRTAILYRTDKGVEVELDHEPEGKVMERVDEDGRIVVGYIVRDDAPITDIMSECMGLLYSFHRRAPKEEHIKGLKALGLDEYAQLAGPKDPYARLLDCYSHGGEIWSLHDEGTQCRWDTARGAGVWVPDDCLRKEIESRPEAERDEACTTYAKQFLTEYNSILEGDVWGVVVVGFDSNGTRLFGEDCWGYVGETYAREMIKENLA